ncbi:MAG: NAD(P)/FAD-dependent oxidoreductase [Phaeovulum sp.]|uniref:NAD(P)/FAD-dependent oxidoreductase n=1 Tax=Phaeovulum sp. TaxID=2934796 RepID=UPI00272F64E7|nr:NAD(P)/FAD-dependent oxidoreductase [Phaeovulum sp.]MDP2063859.1 NAD(P)/FAD-dependent oxidoreductase [Phaeovulum sp.]
MERCDVAILGAGAAGMMAAIEAARRGRRVVVIDHARAPGEKIRISGGGRCNFTNLSTAPERFLSRNPRFARSALSRFTPGDFIARVDRAGIGWHEKTLGQLFCDGSATQIVRMLTDEIRAAGASLRLGVEIGAVRREASFVIETSAGPLGAESLVVATGGKSVPKMGASGLGYRIAEGFGIGLVETRPALVPLTLAAAELAGTSALAGVALPVRISSARQSFDEALLFTHRGISGPAVLQISSYWREGETLVLDLAPGCDLAALLRAARAEAGRSAVHNVLARWLPERLAVFVAAQAGVAGRLADLPNAALDRLAAQVNGWHLRPLGSEGYRTAEVTLGGVDTGALDARTMAARAVSGLYFVGEVVDVTGWLGGYNFQWAWSSGWAAGQVA